MIGTLGAHSAGARPASRFDNDGPAAFLEDGIAIVASRLVVAVLQ
jgi:uncharacterized membrane protein